MKKVICFFIAALSLFNMVGCGDNTPAITEDTAQFKKAVASYCRSHNYGMKVKKFISLKATADKADAVVKMQEAGGTYGISVRWKFKFEKQNGKWKILSHSAK